jgi:simple sugar transport system ATP-binding protein
VNRRKFRKQVSELNERLNFGLPLDSPTENLSVSQGQKAAILTLLLRDTQYLIFDEPTAVLSPLEAEKLFKLLAFLRDEGRGIVFISHKLEEALKIASRVTILRQGKTQICCKPFEISDMELYKYIFGAESFSLSFPVLPELHSIPKKNVLALENCQVNYPGHPLIRGINLEIRPGTIMGITGVRDSGLETLELAITGYLPFKGKLNINGKDIDGTVKNTAKRIKQFRSAGACYLGQGNEGEFLPIRDLLLIHSYRHFLNHGILNIKESNRWVESVLEAAKVPHKKDANAAAFSGGQMQRLLLTREMAVDSALMVLSEPSHSLDLRYRQKLASILREKAGGQTAVIIFSTDVEELIKLSDTIAVLRDGVVSAAVKLQCRQNEKEIIQAAMVGKA